MKKERKLTDQENYKLANELQRLAEDWVNKTFNFIQVDVLNKCCDNMLFEYIRPAELDRKDFLNDYNLNEDYDQYLKDNELEDNEKSLTEFCEIEEQNNFESFRDDREQENYPMWNTCFEFRSSWDGNNEETIQKAIEAGFGIIEGMEDFNTLLFVAGAGYSFYGQHWIPLFLSMPYNSDLRKKYKDVNFRSV